MPSRLWFCNCSVILFAALRLIKSNESCLNSKVSSDPVTVDKRLEVNFTFTISNKCGSDLNIVKVLKKTENSPLTTVCVLWHENNACIPSKGCTCNKETGEYSVTNRIGSSALDLELIAELQDERVFTKSVGILREQYPPSIESISVHTKGKYVDGPVPQNSSVTIVCTWNIGYPPSTSRPRLRDQQGKELEVNHTPQNNEIQHNMDSVQCGDAGEIVCETEDGKSSMNKTLLVKCAPEFTVAKKTLFDAALSDSLHLRFPVRSHSTYIKECELSKNTPSGRLIFNSCPSSERSFSLKGTPPNLMLHFDIINVTTEFGGNYALRLANDAGFGNSLTFMVNVINTFGEGVCKA
ncbi:uncharacterized protein [Littorina saxatilis]|uniref:uncharacterized protein n=1 Tax=Littorina saxatilis TaxID=31220 RepID=UPI0038B4EA62